MYAADPPPLLTLSQMARRLRVPVRWLRAEALSGRLPCLQAERSLLFCPKTVERELARRAAAGEVASA